MCVEGLNITSLGESEVSTRHKEGVVYDILLYLQQPHEEVLCWTQESFISIIGFQGVDLVQKCFRSQASKGKQNKG